MADKFDQFFLRISLGVLLNTGNYEPMVSISVLKKSNFPRLHMLKTWMVASCLIAC